MTTEVWDRIRKRMRRGESLEMANVSTLNLLRQMFESSHTDRRMQSQVDAMLRCKYGDDYQPPETADEDMQIWMNNVITDKKTAARMAGETSDKQMPWWIPALGAAALAAGLTAFMMPRGDDTNTQNTLRPDNINQLIEFAKDN